MQSVTQNGLQNQLKSYNNKKEQCFNKITVSV